MLLPEKIEKPICGTVRPQTQGAPLGEIRIPNFVPKSPNLGETPNSNGSPWENGEKRASFWEKFSKKPGNFPYKSRGPIRPGKWNPTVKPASKDPFPKRVINFFGPNSNQCGFKGKGGIILTQIIFYQSLNGNLFPPG